MKTSKRFRLGIVALTAFNVLLLVFVIAVLFFQRGSQNMLIPESRFDQVVQAIRNQPADEGKERALNLLGKLDNSMRDWVQLTGYLLYGFLGGTLANLGSLLLLVKLSKTQSADG
jgi:hypothetical protein